MLENEWFQRIVGGALAAVLGAVLVRLLRLRREDRRIAAHIPELDPKSPLSEWEGRLRRLGDRLDREQAALSLAKKPHTESYVFGWLGIGLWAVLTLMAWSHFEHEHGSFSATGKLLLAVSTLGWVAVLAALIFWPRPWTAQALLVRGLRREHVRISREFARRFAVEPVGEQHE